MIGEKPSAALKLAATIGSPRMLMGVGVGLAYRVAIYEERVPGERTKTVLVKAARETLDAKVDDTLTGPDRQQLLAGFIRAFFGHIPFDKHEGLPVGLLKAVPPAAYGAGPLMADAGNPSA